MKYIYCLIIVLQLTNCSQKVTTGNDEWTKILIGTWDFVETRDPNGNKIDSYQSTFGTVDSEGPQKIYKKDLTYKQIFTPDLPDGLIGIAPIYTEVGNWKFNQSTMTIEHDLYIEGNSWVDSNLISQKLAVKASDGKYYERIDTKVLKLEKEEMWVDNRGLVDVYRKVK